MLTNRETSLHEEALGVVSKMYLNHGGSLWRILQFFCCLMFRFVGPVVLTFDLSYDDLETKSLRLSTGHEFQILFLS